MSQARMRSIRRKAESVSLSDEIITLALSARRRAEHPPTVEKSVRSRIRFESLVDKRFPRSSSRYRLANAEPLTECDPESMRLVIFLSLQRRSALYSYRCTCPDFWEQFSFAYATSGLSKIVEELEERK